MPAEVAPMPAERRKALGQYFTPPSVAGFALGALTWLDGPGRKRSLIDPACGAGEFIAQALAAGHVAPQDAYGVDADPTLPAVWAERGLAGSRGPWLGGGDGLVCESVAGRPVREECFDWVVGNPPYAGRGLKDATSETLAELAERYEVPRWRTGRLLTNPESLRCLPIEVLFVERFWRLCRPGGWIAIILPVGIFANQRWRFVREWLLPRVTLQAVVGLPRSAFRPGGITARTCLAIARKQPARPGHEVVLAEVEHVGMAGKGDELAGVLARWQAGEEWAGEEGPWGGRVACCE